MSGSMGDDILIVEDVGSSRELLAGLLRQVNILPVRAARNAAEAMEAVKTHMPRIVFLDIELPDQSGLEILKKVHAQDAGVFVVMVSGEGTPANVKVSRESGASGFILKPYKPQKVVEALMMFERTFKKPVLRPSET